MHRLRVFNLTVVMLLALWATGAARLVHERLEHREVAATCTHDHRLHRHDRDRAPAKPAVPSKQRDHCPQCLALSAAKVAMIQAPAALPVGTGGAVVEVAARPQRTGVKPLRTAQPRGPPTTNA